MDLANASTIVTGGAGLLGSACVKMLAERGAHVVVLDKAKDRFDELVERLGPLGAQLSLSTADVRDPQEVADACTQAAAQGPLRVVISCAGWWWKMDRLLSRDGEVYPLDKFQEIIDVNIVGTYNVLCQAAKVMASQDPLDSDGQRGLVVNVASLAGLEGSAGQTAYGTAKAGVAGLTIPAARDVGVLGIRVNCIAPNGMAAEGEVYETGSGYAVGDRILEQTPFPKRFGWPSEFARTCEWFIDTHYINGQVIRLDGGGRLPLR